MLGAFTFVDHAANRSFLMDTQDHIVGGFSKWPDHTPGGLLSMYCTITVTFILPSLSTRIVSRPEVVGGDRTWV